MEYTYSRKVPRANKQFGPNNVLVAMVVVMGLVIVLFPLLARAKEQSKLNTCAGNLKQIGRSIALYMQDHDERFPAGVDPSDKFIPATWSRQPQRQKLIDKLPLLQVPLAPYVSRPDVFRCPADTGGKVMDNSFMDTPISMPATPSYYAAFGSSYLFRTEILFRSLQQKGYWPPDRIPMFFDACGHWHGQGPPLAMDMSWRRFNQIVPHYKYNVLYGDMHVRPLWYSELYASWRRRL